MRKNNTKNKNTKLNKKHKPNIQPIYSVIRQNKMRKKLYNENEKNTLQI